MKKLLFTIFISMLLLTACGPKEADKTSNDPSANTDPNASQTETVDLTDTATLKQYVLTHYSYYDEVSFDTATIKYDDFTKDGNDDVAIYLTNAGEHPVIFLSQKDNEIYEVPSNLTASSVHEVNFSDPFILYTNAATGTGMKSEYVNFYVYDGTKIKNLETNYLTNGYVSAPDYSTETVGKVIFDQEGDYSAFTYRQAQTGNDEYVKKYRYVYDSNTQTFSVTETYNSQNEVDANTPDTNKPVSNTSNDSTADDTASNQTPTELLGKKVKSFTLDGESLTVELEGTFKGIEGMLEYNDAYGGFVVHLCAEGKSSEEVILNNSSVYVPAPCGSIPLTMDEVAAQIDGEMAVFIQEGTQLSVTCELSNYSVSSMLFEEYGNIDGTVSITAWEVMEKDGALTRFQAETLYSRDVEDHINYADYHLVVIPMQTSQNADKLSKRTINVTNVGHEMSLPFTVLGELNSLELTYYENPLDESLEPTVMKVDGPFKDEVVELKAYLPTDFSNVEVTGYYTYQQGIDSISFSLNDAADPSAYQIIKCEAGRNHFFTD